MLRVKTSSGLLRPGWTLVLPLLALASLIASPPDRRLFAVLAAALVYALMQWIAPKCRFRTEHYFSPINLVLVLLLVKMIVAPMMSMAIGVRNELFVGVPSRTSMEGVVVLDTIAYLAFCLGVTFAPARLTGRCSVVEMLSTTPGSMVAIAYTALGVAGFLLVFGSPAGIVQYFSESAAVRNLHPESEGDWAGLLGTMLRPFLAFALVVWWARSVDQSRRGVWRPMLAGLLATIGITLANMTFSFNRSAFLFPVLALVAVYSARTRRIPPLVTASALAILLPVLLALGSYRATVLAPPSAPVRSTTTLLDIAETVQSYAGGPALSGLFLSEVGWGAHLYHGSTLLASLLSPLPAVGNPFRQSNGSALYNRALYGTDGYEDQIIPFPAELFINFHAWGVLGGFFLLGQVLGRAHLWFAAVKSAFGAFVIQYVFMWCATLAVWSLSIFAQIAIYFLAPVYLYCVAVRVRIWLRGMRMARVANSFS